MDLIEKTKKRLEEKQELRSEYDKKYKLLEKLREERTEKVEELHFNLNSRSTIWNKVREIERLQAEIEEEKNLIKNKTEEYLDTLSKQMGIDELSKQTEKLYEKMHSDEVAISFKLEDLLEEMYKISGKRYKTDAIVEYRNDSYVRLLLRIKSCFIDVFASTEELSRSLDIWLKANQKINEKQLKGILLDLTDCGLMNFYEEKTKNQIQNIAKQALINLSKNQGYNKN